MASMRVYSVSAMLLQNTLGDVFLAACLHLFERFAVETRNLEREHSAEA